MLTGRRHGFFDNERLFEITGYSNPQESEHDNFVIGHTSTSISLALGLAKARDLNKDNYNIIALIGDGSLSGGQAFEGLNNASALNSNFIIIVNDNDMSIAKNQGGLYKNLQELRQTKGNSENNFFTSFGFDYCYVDKGNDIEQLIETFNKVKDSKKPIVVHINTLKGKGYKPAEENKEAYHWQLPDFLNQKPVAVEQTYESITTDYMLSKKRAQEPIVVINPATPGAVGFNEDFREKMGDNYIDTAIAEQHAVALASGLAKNGAKPILAVLSSFIQRSYDQLSQDLALNQSSATILIYWGAIGPMDATHLGVFDIPLISNIPNIVYLAPTNKEEYLAMLDYSYNQNERPIVIRVPYGKLISTGTKDTTDYSILNKFEVVKKGSKVALIGLGNFFNLAKEVRCELEKIGVNPTLINPKFISGIDKELLDNLKKDHDIVVTLEDGVLAGGFGEKIARFYGSSNTKVLNFGAKKEFTDRISLNTLYKRYHLTKEQIVEDIKKIL